MANYEIHNVQAHISEMSVLDYNREFDNYLES